MIVTLMLTLNLALAIRERGLTPHPLIKYDLNLMISLPCRLQGLCDQVTTLLASCASCCTALLAKRITVTIAKGKCGRRFDDDLATDTDTDLDTARPLDTDMACGIFDCVSALLVGMSSPLVPEAGVCSVSMVSAVCESMALVLEQMTLGASPLLMSPLLVSPDAIALRAVVLRCLSRVAMFALTSPKRTKTYGPAVVKAVLGPLQRCIEARSKAPTSTTALSRWCFEHKHIPKAMLCAVVSLSKLTRKMTAETTINKENQTASANGADNGDKNGGVGRWSGIGVQRWLQHFLEDRDSVVRVNAFIAITNTLYEGAPSTETVTQLMRRTMEHLADKGWRESHRYIRMYSHNTSTCMCTNVD